MLEFDIKKITDSDQHAVYGVVYSPLAVDTDGETMTAHDVQKMAHEFVASGKISQIDITHDNMPCGAKVVESFIARKGDPDYPEGAWVLGVSIPEGRVWDMIKGGELNGYSMQAAVLKVPRVVLVDIARIALGETFDNTDDSVLGIHSHEYYAEFDSDGRVSFGATTEVLGHHHLITGTVVTENSLGHNHRFGVGA